MTTISNGRGETVSPEKIRILAVGTMVSTDFNRARKFYEEFLGLECVRYAADRMLIRDRPSEIAMEKGEPGGFVIDVRKVAFIEHPQRMLNHWGFTVATTEEVDRIRAEAISRKEYYGIGKIRPITRIHGAYGFYFTDYDENWWEVECRLHGKTNEMVFDAGDVPMF